MDLGLKGKVAIVTGAGGGVGRSTTERLLKEGCKVTLVGRSRSKLTKVISDNDNSSNLLAVSADITKEAEVLNVIEQTISSFDTVDILVNNAGVLNDPIPFHQMSEDQWDNLISTNLIGTFQMTKAVLPIIMDKKNGNIVNISSVLGIRAIPNVPLSIYGATKAGIIMFTKSIAARIDLPVGTVLREEHLTLKKPGTGIPTNRLAEVIGSRLKHPVRRDEVLQLEVLE